MLLRDNTCMPYLKKIPFLYLLLLLMLCMFFTGCFESISSNDEKDSYTVTVIKVIDGDTIKVRFPNETTGTVRFLGIDCPETTIENNTANEYPGITSLGCLTSYGNKAKSFVESLINNSEITIQFDEQTERKDRYGRFLCYVFFDEQDVNNHLLELGYARVFTIESFSKKSAYLETQQQAIDLSKGVWNCTFSMDQLAIEEVHYNAMGNDEENLNDEYVVFLNKNEESMDLTGWSVRDEHGNRFDFPSGFRLAPQSSVTLYTGKGTNVSTALYWHHETPVWNNDGDTVFLYNEKNVVVETFVW